MNGTECVVKDGKRIQGEMECAGSSWGPDRSMHLGTGVFWISILLMGGAFRIRSISLFPDGLMRLLDVNKTEDGCETNIFRRCEWILMNVIVWEWK